MLDRDDLRPVAWPCEAVADHRTPRRRSALQSVARSRLDSRLARYCLLLGCPVLFCLVLGGAVSADDKPAKARDMTGFQVVINGANPVTELEAGDVAKMFLKKAKRWENREIVVPVDLAQNNKIRELFTRAIHGKSVTAIESFWQRIIFSGRGERPDQKQTEEEVLAFVRELPGAIGYVSDDMTLGDGVKELKITQ